MKWIADVIYGLKREYGEPIFLCRDSSTLNLNTGLNVTTTKALRISKAVALPLNLRIAFLKSIGVQRGAFTEDGTSEILLDTKDVPSNFKQLIFPGSYVLDSKNRRRDIKKTDDYTDAFILTVADSTDHVFNLNLTEYIKITDSNGYQLT